MKRTFAFVLSVLMIATIIPASIFSAFARGRGVSANDVINQTVDNAKGQYIPETIVVDGDISDTGWEYNDWRSVTSSNGTWNVASPADEGMSLSYRYQMKVDYYYFYGAAELSDNATEFTVYLKDDKVREGKTGYSAMMVFDLSNSSASEPTYTLYAYDSNNEWTDVSALQAANGGTYFYAEQDHARWSVKDGKKIIEFRFHLHNFYNVGEAYSAEQIYPNLLYFVSAEAGKDGEALYHPQVSVTASADRASSFPSTTTWPEAEDGAYISDEDVNGTGAAAYPTVAEIDGALGESMWVSLTDYPNRWTQAVNQVLYKDLMWQTADLQADIWQNDSVHGYNVGIKTSVRRSAKAIYGAAIIKDACASDDFIRFYFKIFSGANVLTVTMQKNGTTEYGTAALTGFSSVGRDDNSGNFYIDAIRTYNGTDYDLWSIEFYLLFGDGNELASFADSEFIPTHYDVGYGLQSDGAYGTAHPLFGSSFTSTEYSGKHGVYDSFTGNSKSGKALRNNTYPTVVQHVDAYGNYYTPAVGINADGSISSKLFPEMAAAEGYVSGMWTANGVINSGSPRDKNATFIHSLQSDFEFFYGAVVINVASDFEWTATTNDQATSQYPNGDSFTVYINSNISATLSDDGYYSVALASDSTMYTAAYDIWMTADGETHIASRNIELGYPSGHYAEAVGEGLKAIIKEKTYDSSASTADLTFGNIKHSTTGKQYIIEYQIPIRNLAGVGDIMKIGIDNADKNYASASQPIFQYTASFSQRTAEGTHTALYQHRSGNIPNSAWDVSTAETFHATYITDQYEIDAKMEESFDLSANSIPMYSANYSNSTYADYPTGEDELNYSLRLSSGQRYLYIFSTIDSVDLDLSFKVWIRGASDVGELTDDLVKINIQPYTYITGTDNVKVSIGNYGESLVYYDAFSAAANEGKLWEFSSINGKTYIELAIPIEDLGIDTAGGYYCYLEVSDGNLTRYFPNLPNIAASEAQDENIPSLSVFETANAATVDSLEMFPRESIEIDGTLNDLGWKADQWTLVDENINGTLQDVISGDGSEFKYYFQLRMDDEYLYAAAVFEFGTDRSVWTADAPIFQLWIKSGGNQSGDDYNTAASNTFTNLYAITYGVGTTDYSSMSGNVDFSSLGYTGIGTQSGVLRAAWNEYPSYPNGGKQIYNLDYQYARPDSNGILEAGSTADAVDSDGRAYHQPPSEEYAYGDSAIFGEDDYIYNEEECNIIDEETGRTKGETIDWSKASEYKSGAGTDGNPLTAYTEGNEHGVFTDGNDQKFYYGDQTINLNSNKYAVAEFKVKLDEFLDDPEEEFEISIQGRTCQPGTAYNHIVHYPCIGIETESDNWYRGYNMPYWYWRDGQAITITKALREKMSLRTYERPVITLGAKVTDSFMVNGVATNAIRFGGMYTEDDIRAKYNGNVAGIDKTGADSYTDYWDVMEMGMLYMPTFAIPESDQFNMTVDTPSVARMDADSIVAWHQGGTKKTSNFADYESFVFYMTVYNIPDEWKDVKWSFRTLIEYYAENGSEIYYDQTIERSITTILNVNQYGGSNEGTKLPDSYFENESNGIIVSKPGEVNYNGTTIGYIPLDNRPVHVDRVQYAAGSAGFTLVMPDEELYDTNLDATATSSDLGGPSTGAEAGEPAKLLAWLKETEAAEDNPDYYIIALDQILSGGLVQSRVEQGSGIVNNGVYQLTELEKETVEYLIELSKNNEVVYIDTVQRLASTSGYNGLDLEDYNAFRAYGSLSRKVLTGNELTISNIVANYDKDPNGNTLTRTFTVGNNAQSGYVSYTFNESDITAYLNARTRKLALADYLIRNGGTDIEHLYFGVDDSSTDENIQYNEREYIEKTANEVGVSYSLFAGADELSVMGVAAFANDIYTNSYVPVKVQYFGGGEKLAADVYDFQSLETAVNEHLEALGAKLDPSDENALNVLVLTKMDSLTATEQAEYATALADRMTELLAEGKPVCIFGDPTSGGAGIDKAVLSRPILDNTRNTPLGMLLGFSSWNTAGNHIGLALGNAIARYSYLMGCDEVTEESNQSFVKGLTFALVKDICYKSTAGLTRNSAGTVTSWVLDFTNETTNHYAAAIVKKIEASNILGKDLAVMTNDYDITLSNQRWPWYRNYECTFDIDITGTSTAPDDSGNTGDDNQPIPG